MDPLLSSANQKELTSLTKIAYPVLSSNAEIMCSDKGNRLPDSTYDIMLQRVLAIKWICTWSDGWPRIFFIYIEFR